MAVGPLHVWGAVSAAGAALSLKVTNKVNRPSKLVSVGIKQVAGPSTLALSLRVTYGQGWGPVTYDLGSVSVASWAQVLAIPLPIGADVELVATGTGGGVTVEGTLVIEEHEI